MSAGYGVQWKQQDLKEKGPDYMEQFTNTDHNRLSMTQYEMKFGGLSQNLQRRAKSQARAHRSDLNKDMTES